MSKFQNNLRKMLKGMLTPEPDARFDIDEVLEWLKEDTIEIIQVIRNHN